jgi:hypothetical protein
LNRGIWIIKKWARTTEMDVRGPTLPINNPSNSSIIK